jgi:HK97 family phage major capsid protein
MGTKLFHRTVDIPTSGAIDEKNRAVALSFSSEFPVDCGDFDEVLSHEPGDVDLSRLNDGHPVLRNHDPNSHVGTIDKAWVSSRRGRAIVRFSKSQKGEEAWQDVLGGILKHVSVGYERVKKVASKKLANGREVVSFAFRPYEVSLVPVPADPTVGIGRAKTIAVMNDNDNNNESNDGGGQGNRHERRAVDARVRDINGAVEMISRNHPELETEFRRAASEGILLNRSPQEVNNSLMAIIRSNPRQFERVDASIGMDAREVGRYSLTRAIRARMENRPLDGIEAEASRACERKFGQAPEGFYLPLDVVSGTGQRAQRDMSVTTFGAGGGFVQTNVLTSVVEVLRNRMVTQRLGVQTMSGLNGNVAIPRQTGAATGYSLAESAALTQSNQAIDQVLLSPKRVGAYSEYTKQLLLQSSVDVENFIRDDLMKVIAIKWDKLALEGTGAGSEPVGILNTTGIGSITFGGTPTYAKMVSFETALSVANADDGRMAYVTSPNTKAKLKTTTKIGSTFPVYIWEEGEWRDGSNDGMVNQYRAASTNQISNDAVVFGNFADAYLALWGGLDVVVDPFTLAINAKVRITVNTFGDFAVRHPASFAFSSDSGNQ